MHDWNTKLMPLLPVMMSEFSDDDDTDLGLLTKTRPKTQRPPRLSPGASPRAAHCRKTRGVIPTRAAASSKKSGALPGCTQEREVSRPVGRRLIVNRCAGSFSM